MVKTLHRAVDETSGGPMVEPVGSSNGRGERTSADLSSLLVELNRVRLGNVTVNHKKGGSVDLVVRIPAAAKRGTVTVTIAAGGQVATKSFKIL